MNNDLVGFFAMISIWLFGISEAAASQVGAWIALASSSICGSLIALGMAGTLDWKWYRMLWFVFIRVFAAMMLSMSIVKVIGLYLPEFGPGIVLAPVAFLITCDPLRVWAMGLLNSMVKRKLDGR